MGSGQNGAIRSPVYGPFEVISDLAAERTILSLPFKEVAGCNVIVSLADNYAIRLGFSQSDASHLFPGAEISIWGAIQSSENCLRRACLHMLSGPIRQLFEFADGWDTILFKARNMAGGSTRNAGLPPFPTQAENASLKISIYVMPRSGFATPGDKGSACVAG